MKIKSFNLNNSEVKKFYKIMIKSCENKQGKKYYLNFINNFFQNLSDKKIKQLIFLFFNDINEKNFTKTTFHLFSENQLNEFIDPKDFLINFLKNQLISLLNSGNFHFLKKELLWKK